MNRSFHAGVRKDISKTARSVLVYHSTAQREQERVRKERMRRLMVGHALK
jgi:hypothetical protein